MPKFLMLACIVLAGVFLACAGIAPYYEVGHPRYTTPLINCVFALLVVLFMLRKRWTWRYVLMVAVIFPLLRIAFPPTVKFYGEWTSTAQILDFAGIVACLAILGCLARSKTKQWFFSERSA